MKQFMVLFLTAFFGLGLIGAASRAADEPTGKEPPKETMKAAEPIAHVTVEVPATPVAVTNLWILYYAIIGLLAVNAILLALGLSSLGQIKASIDKLASR